MMRIYLAHSVHERPRGKKIQTELESMGYEVYNPFYPDGKPQRDDIEAIDKGFIVAWDMTDKEKCERIVNMDLEAVRKSDIMIAIIPNRRTYGIPCEHIWAWLLKIPVYVLCPEDMKGHPWIVALSEVVFVELDNLMMEMWELYAGSDY